MNVNRFVITFFVIELPAFTRFHLSSLPSTHHQHRYNLASRVFATAIRFPSFVVFVPHSFTTRSFFPPIVLSFVKVVNKNDQSNKTLDTNINFTFLLQVSSLARFTHGSQRYVILQGPQFVCLTPYLGTRRHRLPRHRPDFILIPAPDGVCLLPPITAIH